MQVGVLLKNCHNNMIKIMEEDLINWINPLRSVVFKSQNNLNMKDALLPKITNQKKPQKHTTAN